MNRFGKSLYIMTIYLFLYLPIIVVVILSFNNAEHSLVWQSFTFKWYATLLNNKPLLQVAWHSLALGLLAASSATIIGTLTAVTLFRYQFFGKKLLHGLIFILILAPEIVMAISLLLMYSVLKVPLGFWSLLLAHTTLCVPFVVVTVYGRISTLNSSVFEAARDLGASDSIIFGKIVIPLLLPAIAAGWLLSFTLSLDDVIISYFVSGPTFDILPLKIYSMVRLGVKPEVNALCTLILAFTLFVAIITYRTVFRRK
jgi:spermidine/putrescine transport system permease protein